LAVYVPSLPADRGAVQIDEEDIYMSNGVHC